MRGGGALRGQGIETFVGLSSSENRLPDNIPVPRSKLEFVKPIFFLILCFSQKRKNCFFFFFFAFSARRPLAIYMINYTAQNIWLRCIFFLIFLIGKSFASCTYNASMRAVTHELLARHFSDLSVHFLWTYGPFS